jgi:hypothetical protein
MKRLVAGVFQVVRKLCFGKKDGYKSEGLASICAGGLPRVIRIM